MHVKLAFAAVLVAGLQTAADAEPVKILADWSATPGQTAPMMPVAPKYAPDLFRHYGKTYVVEPLFLAGGGRTLTALAARETDVSAFTPQVLALSVLDAKLDLRIIGQQVSTEVPGYASTPFWVRKDEIQKVEDLRRKTIGVPARGSTPDAVVRTMLGRYGMQDGRDYQFVELRYPAILPALDAKKIDAGPLILPFGIMAEKNPALKPLFSLGEVNGPTETVVFAARADWLAANRAAAVDFLEDNLRLRRFLYDPARRADVLKLVAEVTKQPATNFAEWVYTRRDYYIDPNAMVNAERLQKNMADLHKMDMVRATVNLAPLIDLSLVREAATRLDDRP